MQGVGTHLVLELWGASNLNSPPVIEQALRDIVAAIDVTLLDLHVYPFSPMGVTGAATHLDHAEQLVLRVRAATELPIAVGFGLATGEQARTIARVADGVVVGSALVERLGEGLGPARALLTELRAAVQGPFDRPKP